MTLEIGAGIGNERKAGGVRLGKSIKSEGLYGLDDLLLASAANAIRCHARRSFASSSRIRA